VRIVVFLLSLAAAFGIAVAAGAALGPEPTADALTTRDGAMDRHDGKEAAAMADGHRDGHGAGAVSAPRGLAAADDGLRLVVATPELERGRMRTLRFRIVDTQGRAMRAFNRTHERRMHTIVVRRDLTGFQHVHPRMDADGTWSVPLRLDDPGSYRLYADFSHDGEPRTLASDLRVDGGADLLPLPDPAPTAGSDGGDTVHLNAGQPRTGPETTLRFAVERNGQPVAVEPYLGAGGHLVALREGDLAFLHVHPTGAAGRDGRIAFMSTFPSAGRYRLFLQYRVGAQVRTAAFTLEVTP